MMTPRRSQPLQLADAVRHVEETMKPEQRKEARWHFLRQEAEALLKRSKP